MAELMNDLHDPKRSQALLQAQTHILERIARGEALSATLHEIVRLAEQLSDGVEFSSSASVSGGPLYSILLLEEGQRLRHGAAPSLPDAWNAAIDGVEIGPQVGSCGAAAYLKQPVYVSDIGVDPRWALFRELALSHGLRACWSTPILSTEGEVLGTIALYHRAPASPQPDDLQFVEAISSLAGIAIERKNAEAALSLRARQQAVVAELGQRALTDPALDPLMEEAVRNVAAVLEVEFCKVLELLPGREGMFLRAGIGWKEGLVGNAVIGIGLDSQAGYTLLSKEPVLVWDLRSETRFSGPPLLHEHGVVSGISVVIPAAEGPWGVMGAHATRCRRFTEDDIHFFQSVANVLASAIERRRIEERLREETRTIEAIHRVGQVLAAELDLPTLLQRATDAATEITDAQFGAFFYNVTDAAGESFMLYTLSGISPDVFASFPMPRATSLFGPIFRGESSIRIEDVRQDSRYGRNAPYYGLPPGHPPVRSYLAAPVVSRSGEALGGLFFGHEEAGVFTARHERIVESLAAQAAVALDNAHLFQQAKEAEQRLLSQQEVLRRHAEELVERDRAKDEFLAMLAHELRNPLSPMLSAVELMERRALDDPILARARDTLRRQVRQMTRLVDDLLDVSRITRGAIELKLERMDLCAVVERSEQTSRPFMEERGHRFVVTVEPGEYPVEGDPMRLEQVLNNLLNNAAKYTDPGGAITLRLARESGGAALTVTDTGRGIPHEMLPRIFDLFTQVEPGIDRGLGGLGLGLTLAQRLVAMHHGSLFAHSEGPGQGSEFTVRLPLRDAEGELSGPGAVPLPAPTEERSLALLVVDDNQDAAITLSHLLEIMGHRVAVAYDGLTGVEAALANPPDAALLDIGLPGIDGYEVARRLRAHAETAGVTLIAISGYGQARDRERAKEAGFDHHLIKPVDPDALQALLRTLG